MNTRIILWSVAIGVSVFIMGSTPILQYINLPASVGAMFLLRGASWHGLSAWIFISAGILVQAAICAVLGLVISLLHGKYLGNRS